MGAAPIAAGDRVKENREGVGEDALALQIQPTGPSSPVEGSAMQGKEPPGYLWHFQGGSRDEVAALNDWGLLGGGTSKTLGPHRSHDIAPCKIRRHEFRVQLVKLASPLDLKTSNWRKSEPQNRRRDGSFSSGISLSLLETAVFAIETTRTDCS